MNKLIARVRGNPVWWGDGCCSFVAGMTIDADGSPRAYGPDNKGLDYTENAGHPGNWWGVVTRNGRPVIQSGLDEGQPCKGMYISTTSLQNAYEGLYDVRRYVNSEEVPFIVVPGFLRKRLPGIVMGCRAEVRYAGNNRVVECVVADSGPATHLGEGSIKLAKQLNIPSSARSGGLDKQLITYKFWPGVVSKFGYRLQPL